VLLLFDVDGTLLLTGGAGARALDRAFLAHHGIDGAMRGIAAGGKTDPVIVEEMYRQTLGRTPTAAEVDGLLETYLGFLDEEVARAAGYRLMPQVPEALARLEAEGHLLGLATGNVERGARIKLGRGGLSSRFSFGGFGCDSPRRAELVARAYERGQRRGGRAFAPDETYVIGDTPLDVAAARAVGLRAVAVATGSFTLEALGAAKPDLVLSHLGELAERLPS
jgi:phosphoglycolate phosphatase-like HAD superfamily hydrolase